MIPQRIQHQTSLRQHPLLPRHLPPRKRQLEILTNLLQQFPLQIRDLPPQRSNLINGPIALKVRHQLYDRPQQLRTLPVLPALPQPSQLLIRRREHLQALQRRHRERQVPLRPVKPLDIRRHLRDRLLGLERALPHAIDLLQEDGELGFRGLDPGDAVGV